MPSTQPPPTASEPAPDARRGDALPRVAGFVALYLVLDRVAAAADSRRGEAGAWVCVVVVLAAAIVERFVSGLAPRTALAAVGLRRPALRGALTALAVAGGLAVALPAIAWATGGTLRWEDDALLVGVGVLLQGGIAEEVVWRGYLFRHLRAGRSFARAAALSAAVVGAQHLLLFATLPAPVAAAAVGVAVATSFAFARLFELGGGSCFGPAVVHAVVQGALKVVRVEGAESHVVALAWMAASVGLPLAAFLVPPPRDTAAIGTAR